MELKDLEQVVLPAEGTYKFVLAEVTDGKDERTVLVGQPGVEWHRHIVHQYPRKLPIGFHLESVSGGGRIKVTEDSIHAYGYSGDYGKADQETVEKILKEYASDLGKEVLVQMGKGY